MTSPNPPDDTSAASPPPPQNERWPWPQLAFLTASVGLFLTGLQDFFLLAGLEFEEATETTGIRMILAGAFIAAAYHLRLWISKYFWTSRPQVEKAPFSPELRLINTGVGCVALSTVWLGLFIPLPDAGHKGAEQQAADKTENDIATWQTVRSEKSPIQVDLPSHWVEAPDTAQGQNDMICVDLVNDLALDASSIPKEDVTYPDIHAWVDASLREMATNLENTEIIERTFRAKPGPSSVDVVLECTIEKTRYVFLMRFIDMPNYYAFIRLAATPSRFREHEDTLRRIARSVRSE